MITNTAGKRQNAEHGGMSASVAQNENPMVFITKD
jgi:hypothetical protein